ncbi:hypothetical protein LJR084_005273 [Variovorax sp. LjRoot84]
MPRRKKTSPLEEMVDVVSMLPWWVPETVFGQGIKESAEPVVG